MQPEKRENKMIKKETMKLYLVTDRSWLNGKTLSEDVRAAIEGGVTLVQLREKALSEDAFLQEAIAIKKITDAAGIPLIINDSPEVALAADAAGVHIGQQDGSVSAVRKMLGKTKILGVSARTVEQAQKAEAEGADYLGVGAVFGTTTKEDASNLSIETLQAICRSVTIPVVAIGGINEANIDKLNGSGIDGVAVVSSILAQADVKKAAQRLRKSAEKVVE